MTTQHTPGPWRIGDAGHTIFGPKSEQPAPVTVATMPPVSPRMSASERKANALLIHAAPALLAALIALEHASEHGDSESQAHAAKQARAAIATAQGRA